MSYKFGAACLKFRAAALFLLFFQATGAQGLSDLADLVDRKAKTLKTDAVLLVGTADTVVFQKDNKLFSALRGQASIGSSSQWLTTALVLLLADEGRISLDDPVSQYLPVFGKYGKNYITLRHCLTHFTGIQAESKKLFDKKKFASLDEEVASYAAREIQTNPGTEFRYSELGFAIAARVLEVTTKKKFDMLAQQKLFRPMGMRQTTFATVDGSLPDPAAGARSTAADLMRFLRMLLNGGKHNGQQILSPESVAELQKIYGAPGQMKGTLPKGTDGQSYALGAWAPEGSETQATVLTVSSGNALPLVDFCRGYAFILLLKEPKEDKNDRTGPAEVKEIVDGVYPEKCNR